MSDVVCFDLGELLPGLPGVPRETIEQALAPAPMLVDRGVLVDALAVYEEEHSSMEWLKGRASLMALLDRIAGVGVEEVSFNAVGKSVHCPRRYPLCVPGSPPALLLSARQTEEAYKKEAALLSATPKAVRQAFSAPDGFTFIDFDIDRCHLAALAMLSGDSQLIEDVGGDPHEVTGLMFAPHLYGEERRKVGKRVNSAIAAGMTERGLVREMDSVGSSCSEEDVKKLLSDWWRRYPKGRAAKEGVQMAVENAIDKGKQVTLKMPGGGTRVRFNHWFLSGKTVASTRYDTPEGARAHALRSVWTALFRSVEFAFMDLVIVLAHRLGLKLCVPLYDGALWLACEHQAVELADQLKSDAEGLLRAFGMPTGATVDVRRTWA